MHVLIVSQYFWPEPFRISEIAKSLSEQGVNVTVITGKPNYPEGDVYSGYKLWGITEENFGDVRVVRVPIFPRRNKSTFSLIKNYISFIISATLIAPFKLHTINFDLILVYGLSPVLQAIPALFIKLIKRAPLILYLQDLWPESLSATGYIKNRFVISVIRSIVGLIYQGSDLVLLSSRPFEAHVKRLSPKTKTLYLPNSVDKNFMDPASGIRSEMPVLDSGFNIVFAGNIGKAQAMNIVIDAAEKLASYVDIKFVIIGDGSVSHWIREEIKSRKIHNVYLAGRYPPEAMPYLLSRASVLLVTLADYPIFSATVPSKLQAYMAVGRPIIAALNGEGARLIIEAKAGLCVPAEDAHSLTQAILDLYSLPETCRDQMGINGRNYYKENFDQAIIISKLIELINSFADK